MSKTFLFQAIHLSQIIQIQTILFSISIDFVYTQLNVKTVLYYTIQFSVSTVTFQTIQFSISLQFNSIQPIDRALSGATSPGQSGPVINSNEGVFSILQSPSITGISPLDCLVSYPGNSLGGDLTLFTQPLRSGRIWHKVNFLSGV